MNLEVELRTVPGSAGDAGPGSWGAVHCVSCWGSLSHASRALASCILDKLDTVVLGLVSGIF